jgi:pimeloyl-ACP methyl ester carboxylesterase
MNNFNQKMKIFITLFALTIGFTNCYAQDFVIVEQDSIEYEIKGSGEPWIVLVSGVGSSLSAYNSIFDSLSQYTTVVRFSRAGLGKSSYNINRKHFNGMVEELEALIDILKVPNHFILGGHSYGGLFIRAYAAKNPTKVAGLLSIDPTFEDYFTVLEPFEPNARQIERSEFTARFNQFTARNDEVESLFEVWNSPEKWKNWFNYPSSIPHFVLTSLKIETSPLRGSKEIMKARYEAQNRTIINSDINMQIGVSNARHYLQTDRPELTIDAFKMLINLIRASSDPI